ncbi:hypothetical protein SESBI_41502 [Sesbania bispinosa]|nr:hypothetical protein SESBI_41502 [Sesbania bispinosa]
MKLMNSDTHPSRDLHVGQQRLLHDPAHVAIGRNWLCSLEMTSRCSEHFCRRSAPRRNRISSLPSTTFRRFDSTRVKIEALFCRENDNDKTL